MIITWWWLLLKNIDQMWEQIMDFEKFVAEGQVADFVPLQWNCYLAIDYCQFDLSLDQPV